MKCFSFIRMMFSSYWMQFSNKMFIIKIIIFTRHLLT
nr:MAG TPA: hypothetical protein [Caudoviricetes sp.]